MHSQTEIELVRLLNVELLVSAPMIDAVRTRMLANGLVTRVAGAGAGANWQAQRPGSRIHRVPSASSSSVEL